MGKSDMEGVVYHRLGVGDGLPDLLPHTAKYGRSCIYKCICIYICSATTPTLAAGTARSRPPSPPPPPAC